MSSFVVQNVHSIWLFDEAFVVTMRVVKIKPLFVICQLSDECISKTRGLQCDDSIYSLFLRTYVHLMYTIESATRREEQRVVVLDVP